MNQSEEQTCNEMIRYAFSLHGVETREDYRKNVGNIRATILNLYFEGPYRNKITSFHLVPQCEDQLACELPEIE